MIKLLTFLTLIATSSAALAQPVRLSEEQMGAVAAGFTAANVLEVTNTTNSIVQQSMSISIASCTDCTGSASGSAGSGGVGAGAGISVSAVASSSNFASVTQAGFFGLQSAWRW